MSSSEVPSSQAFFSALDALIASQFPDSTPSSSLQALGVPAVSIAVLSSSNAILTHTISNPSSPTDSDTLFQACSISKPILGLALLRTIDQGKLCHDDAVTKHLPAEYLDAISTPATRKLLDHLTIAHLVSHTGGTTVSGFPGYDNNGPTPPSLLTVLRGSKGSNTPQIHLSRLPGLKWRYSGGGTTILQAILESIHHKPLPEIVHELVFQPLGMTRSFYNPTLPANESNFAKCFATGVTETHPSRWHIQPELGAAGVWSTPGDLLRAQRGIRDAALGKSLTFLSKDLALKGLQAVEGANGFGYGGWISGRNWFGHTGGNNPGYTCRTLMTFDFDGKSQLGNAEGEGIAVMTASALGTDLYLKIIQAVAYLRHWPGREILGLHDPSGEVVPFVARDSHIDERWTEWKGKWKLHSLGEDRTVKIGHVVQIVEEDGGSVLKMGEFPGMRMLKAAMPSSKAKERDGEMIDLVVDGLEMMITLGVSEEGEKMVQIWLGTWEGAMEYRRA